LKSGFEGTHHSKIGCLSLVGVTFYYVRRIARKKTF
jgi:hypothetical protein